LEFTNKIKKMKCTNENEIHLMYSTKGSCVVKFNLKGGYELQKGDAIVFNRGYLGISNKIVEVAEVLESRQYTLKDFNYVTVKLTKPF
jgi:hypothetical protein